MNSPYRQADDSSKDLTPEQIERFFEEYTQTIGDNPSLDQREHLTFIIVMAIHKRLQRMEDFLTKRFEDEVAFHKEAAKEGIRQ